MFVYCLLFLHYFSSPHKQSASITVNNNSTTINFLFDHKQSFKFKNKKYVTELSKAVWNAKDVKETPLIE